MRTARQPTIVTWFVFTAVFAVPLALPSEYLTVQLGPNGERSYAGIFAAGSCASLIITLLVAVCFRRFFWTAVVCFALKSVWFVIVMILLDNGNAIHWNMVSHWLTGLASSTWLEWWSVVILSQNGIWKDTTSYWLGITALSSTVYAVIAVLLAKTCRLREPLFTPPQPRAESPAHSPAK